VLNFGDTFTLSATLFAYMFNLPMPDDLFELYSLSVILYFGRNPHSFTEPPIVHSACILLHQDRQQIGIFKRQLITVLRVPIH
jgi:hypothetical protein